jgi:hypothetical protein
MVLPTTRGGQGGQGGDSLILSPPRGIPRYKAGMKHAVALLALLLFTVPARAAPARDVFAVTKAGDLETACVLTIVLSEVKNRTFSASEREAAMYCSGYFMSLNEMFMSLRDGNLNPFNICYPQGAVPPAVPLKAFVEFVHAHPEAGPSYAMPVVIAALTEAFPCQKVQPR